MARKSITKEKKVGVVEKRRTIRQLLKTVKDPEFLDEIEDLLRKGRKLTEFEKLDRNFGVVETVEWVDTRFDRQKGMQMFIEDIWH